MRARHYLEAAAVGSPAQVVARPIGALLSRCASPVHGSQVKAATDHPLRDPHGVRQGALQPASAAIGLHLHRRRQPGVEGVGLSGGNRAHGEARPLRSPVSRAGREASVRLTDGAAKQGPPFASHFGQHQGPLVDRRRLLRAHPCWRVHRAQLHCRQGQPLRQLAEETATLPAGKEVHPRLGRTMPDDGGMRRLAHHPFARLQSCRWARCLDPAGGQA